MKPTLTLLSVVRAGSSLISSRRLRPPLRPASATVGRRPPSVALVKAVNPAGETPSAADLIYRTAFTNEGGVPVHSFIITDPIPAGSDFKVNSTTAGAGTTGLAVTVTCSSDGVTTRAYVPASGAGGAPAGHDRATILSAGHSPETSVRPHRAIRATLSSPCAFVNSMLRLVENRHVPPTLRSQASGVRAGLDFRSLRNVFAGERPHARRASQPSHAGRRRDVGPHQANGGETCRKRKP